VSLLGAGRLLAVKAAGYHEHVSEYGQHWNFFLSLAAVWLLAEAVHAAADTPARSALVGVLLATVHQWALLLEGFSDFVFSAPRDSFLSANREGLLSVSGYLSVYVVGEGLASWACFSGAARAPRLAAVSAASWLVWGCCSTCVQQTSRRLSNAAYGALVVAVANTLLLAFQLTSSANRTPAVRLLRGMRQHSLKIFLAANVLTGSVNHAVSTLQQGPCVSLVIIFVYVSALCVLAISL